MIVETLKEVLQSISSHKMRLAVTVTSVVWSIFLLTFLMGVGNSIEYGASEMLGLDTLCVFSVNGGMSQKPWMGKGRHMNNLKDSDIEFLKEKLGEKARSVEAICEGPAGDIVCGRKHIRGKLMGVTPGYLTTQALYVSQGEGFSSLAMLRHEKVCVIPEDMNRIFMSEGESPIGRKLTIGDQIFTIMGTYNHDIMKNLPPQVLIPYQTAIDCFNPERRISTLYIISEEKITSTDNADAFAQRLQRLINEEHSFDPEDSSATMSQCTSLRSLKIIESMEYLQFFIWFICLSSLMVGIAGISNIMMIAEKERTKEYGIRKVMGSSDISIVWLVLLEALSATLTSGYIGLVLGIGALRLTISSLETFASSNLLSYAPISLNSIFLVLSLLVMSGILAGLFPAIKVFRMNPIEALNT